MNVYYKIELVLNLLKYYIRDKFTKHEDKYILFLKEYFKNRPKGFYIDVGCYHPIRLSNTKFLYNKGWSGINIDISKKSIDLFKIARKKDINLNIGISDKNGTSEAYFKKDLFHANTLAHEHSEIFLNKPRKKKIKIKTLSSVINEYAKNKKIDLIDVDCEGKDLEVLQGVDLKKYEIDLISVELHEYSDNTKRKKQLILDIMKKNNFKKLFISPGTKTIIFKKI
tara:strand:+ start:395 stop:1069 length:675 start_codon:yes stop_codon:yes gene_type:complete